MLHYSNCLLSRLLFLLEASLLWLQEGIEISRLFMRQRRLWSGLIYYIAIIKSLFFFILFTTFILSHHRLLSSEQDVTCLIRILNLR